VVAHRRLHLRQDYVRSAGFRKVGGNEPCDSPGCSYAQRHTHYHCDTCDGGVLSRAQLAAHKHRTAFPKPDAATTPSDRPPISHLVGTGNGVVFGPPRHPLQFWSSRARGAPFIRPIWQPGVRPCLGVAAMSL